LKKDELKEALRIEASIFVPNHRDQIKERVRLVATPKDKATSILKKKMAPVLALGMLTIILTIVLPFLFKSPMAPISNTFVTIDINPSIEIEADPNSIIKNVRALNKDAVLLLSGEEKSIINKGLIEGVLAIIKLASESDYLNDNDLLITTVNNNQDHETTLMNQIISELNNYLDEIDFKGQLSQVKVNKRLKKEAKELGISVGKLNHIQTIIDLNPQFTIDDLKDKSIKELNNIIKRFDSETIDFEEKYVELFTDLTSKALVELDKLEEEVNLTRGKINRLNTVLKQLEKAKDKINSNKYQNFLAQTIEIYSSLAEFYPDELEPYSEDMEVEEIVNSLNSFIDRTNSRIEHIHQSKNQKVREIRKFLIQKIKENLKNGVSNPFDIDIEEIINNIYFNNL